MGYLLGLAGLIIGYILGKITGATNKSTSVDGDQITGSGIKATRGSTVAGESVVGGNQSNEKSRQNNN